MYGLAGLRRVVDPESVDRDVDCHPVQMDSTTDKRWIVDVGMHHGDDTAFYLAKGFKVIAVEAAPELVASVSEQEPFRSAVARGDLVILNVAVADHEGTIEFYLSDQDLWASTDSEMAARFGTAQRQITVPCTTLDKLLEPFGTPYYVKIDVEGADRVCVESLGNLEIMPRFLSFEANLPEPEETLAMLSMLESYGYRRFKLVNQALHDTLTLPRPPLEGSYVEARFTKHCSGPFGEESPGRWLSMEEIRERVLATTRQQAVRIEYEAKGTVFGIPLGRMHKPLMALYNARPVARARTRYAEFRGVEVGGWFDIHAAL